MEWVWQSKPEEKTRLLAERTGCTETNSAQILGRNWSLISLQYTRRHKLSLFCILFTFAEHLMAKDPLDLYNNMFNTLSPDEKRRGMPFVFKPVVELDSVLKSKIFKFIIETLI